MDPRYYGQARHPRTETVARERDDFEIALAVAAFERRTPVLAICRGVQIVNVALGGSLHQHVPDIVTGDVPHVLPDDDPARRGLIDKHVVATSAGSRLAGIAGPALVTGSRHHQAIDRLGAGLTVVARTPDGIVEALEPPDATRFLLGVQWHPESTVDDDGGASLAIFRALVDVSREVGAGWSC